MLDITPKCTKESDIWSIGCVAYELFTLDVAFPGNMPFDNVRAMKYTRISNQSI